MRFCPECGSKLSDQYQHFCQNCGVKFSSAMGAPQESPQPPQESPQPPQESPQPPPSLRMEDYTSAESEFEWMNDLTGLETSTPVESQPAISQPAISQPAISHPSKPTTSKSTNFLFGILDLIGLREKYSIYAFSLAVTSIWIAIATLIFNGSGMVMLAQILNMDPSEMATTGAI